MVEPFVAFEPESLEAGALELGELALATVAGPLQMRRVIDLVADPGTLFELRATWCMSVRTVLGRIGGRSIGIVATDPCCDRGVLTADACDKIARFVYLCDAFGLPLVFIVDTEGIEGGIEGLSGALPRHAARIPLALSTVRVPICTFVVGRCPGIAQLLIGGVGRMMDLFYYAMWPTARLEGLGIRREDDVGVALTVAERFGVDEVLDPGLTRRRLLDVIAAAPVVPRREVPHQIDNW